MRAEPPKLLNAAQTRYLLVSLLMTGGGTLVLELAGARLISPYYGSSIYTWSALITVTLVSLAAGYNYGGMQADSKASLTLYSRVIGWAGLAVAVIPVIRQPVLKITSPLGIQSGAVASACLLVGPALFLLGQLGPLAIRLQANALATVGRSAGNVYAVSTIGSVLGAALTGFVLIPHFQLSRLFFGLALMLLLLCAWGLLLSTKKVPVGPALAAVVAAWAAFWPREHAATNIRLLQESAYGQIKILDSLPLRYLMVNGTSQSIAVVPERHGDPFESDSPYIHTLELGAHLAPAGGRALVIGLGAGLLPGALERVHGMITDSVEIDPAMLAAAREFYGYSPRGDVFTEDGRVVLEKNERRYSLIVLDAFGAEQPPFHLFTTEAFVRIRESLSPGGLLAVNLVSLVDGPGSEPWLSSYKTLRAVFPEVKAYQSGPGFKGMANINFYCSQSPLDFAASARSARALIREDVRFMLEHELRPTASELDRVAILTDDYAPLESLLARSILRWRASLQEMIGDVMLY